MDRSFQRSLIALLGFGVTAVWSAVGFEAALACLVAAAASYLGAGVIARQDLAGFQPGHAARRRRLREFDRTPRHASRRAAGAGERPAARDGRLPEVDQLYEAHVEPSEPSVVGGYGW